mgnify:FL=1
MLFRSGAFEVTLAGAYDGLDIVGSLALDAATDSLVLDGVIAEGEDYTLVTFASLTGTFDEVYFGGSLVADPTADGAINGTHKLVYNATTIDLMATAVSTPHPGDTDNNGTVDVTDLGNLSTAYGTTSGATWLMGDFDGNGMVDVTDLGILSTEYGWVATPPTAGAVPEPATLALLKIGRASCRERV